MTDEQLASGILERIREVNQKLAELDLEVRSAEKKGLTINLTFNEEDCDPCFSIKRRFSASVYRKTFISGING